MSLVSVIVPVYNVEEYLAECVESILSQTYHNIEIILVDDGSTDESGLLCEEYAKKDDRVRVFHKENGGLSDARNYGIDRAEGSYITFVDSDDILHVSCIEKLYTLMSCSGSGVSICNMERFEETESIRYTYTNPKVCILDAESALKELLLQRCFDVSACGKMYCKELFNNVSYPTGQLYEDLGTTYKVIMKTEKVCYINQSLYYYRYRPGSITTRPFNMKMLDIFEQLNHFKTDVLEVHPSLTRYFEYREANCASLVILSIVNSHTRDESTDLLVLQMRNKIKDVIGTVLLMKDLAMKKKIKLVLCVLNEKLLLLMNRMNKAYLLR